MPVFRNTWCPGADQTSLGAGSIDLRDLAGNLTEETYELSPGPYTALVWCEALSVEFVGAAIQI